MVASSPPSRDTERAGLQDVHHGVVIKQRGQVQRFRRGRSGVWRWQALRRDVSCRRNAKIGSPGVRRALVNDYTEEQYDQPDRIDSALRLTGSARKDGDGNSAMITLMRWSARQNQREQPDRTRGSIACRPGRRAVCSRRVGVRVHASGR